MLTPADLEHHLARHPRITLQPTATPLEPLPRLGAALGLTLAIKRDDLTLMPFGGNKVRQLEYYFGAAQAERADTVLVTGAVQSNFVRATAAVAAKLGLDAVLQLEERVADVSDTYRASGNVLLDHLMGAHLLSYPVGEDETGADHAIRAEAERLRASGKRPYVIPLSADAPPRGALGYVRAAIELAADIARADMSVDHIVVPSGSGATHAGLLFGLRALGITTPVHGACVRRARTPQHARITGLLSALATLLGVAAPTTIDDVRTHDPALAPGYGQLNDATCDAIAQMARLEGQFVDPVYSAKTLATAIALTANGTIAPGSTVLLIHTGGLPGLFAYAPDLQTRIAARS
ncbi:MAG: D-cysteine desulfhydrase family protein [Pseudomonadota bacterium]